MSEYRNNRTTRLYRKRLLSTVSMAALLLAVAGEAQAGDADEPAFQLDLGWHFQHVGGQGDTYTPAFLQITPRPDFETVSPVSLEKTLAYAYGAEGALSYRPEGTDWVISGSVRFGRAHSHKMYHQQTAAQYSNYKYPAFHALYPSQSFPRYIDLPRHKFTDTNARNSENHIIADFMAGKDVGLGMFGHDSSSSFGIGLRFAQFNSKSEARIRENPDEYWPTGKNPFKYPSHHHSNYASFHAERSFNGVGPALSWNASAPIAGNLQDGELAIDWGLNAAVLFGKQKAKIHNYTKTAYYYRSIAHIYFNTQVTSKTNNPPDRVRSRSVTVPNFGGFAGLSYRIQNFRVSLGYRADFFVGAIDGGWDKSHDITRSFNGPFASVSFGVSDF